MSKSPGDRISDWEADELSETQKSDAANDAYASLLLYQRSITPVALDDIDNSLNAMEIDDVDNNYHRVLLDVYHFMKRYPVPKLHPLYALFVNMLRDAIFIVSSDDLGAIKQVLMSRGLSEEQIKRLPSSYFVSKGRVRRRIPESDTLSKRVNSVVLFFKQLDPTFITPAVLKCHESCMTHLLNGCLSDHPDVQLYFEHEVGNAMLFKKLKCARGSSQLEGFHAHVANATSGKIMSPQLFDLLLLEMVHRWNTDRAVDSNLECNLHSYDIRTLTSINLLYLKQPQLFTQAPLDSFKSTLFCDGWEAEKFGCPRILNSRSYLELLSDGAEPAEIPLLALDDESDLQTDVELPDEILALGIQVFQAVEDAEPNIPSGIVQQLVTTEEMEAKIMHAPSLLISRLKWK